MYRTDFWTLWEKARVGCFEGIFDFTSSLRCTLMFYAFFWACVLNSKDRLISFVFHGVMLSILYVC